MRSDTFRRFARIIYDEAGISLSDEKRSLLMNRIGKRVRSLGLNSEEEYLEQVEADKTQEEIAELIDAVSTNVTYFYREAEHFTFLARLFDQWRAEGRNRIRIWSAACSSGEEPYTIAMLAAEHLDLGHVRFQLLATDICSTVLEHAVEGMYEERQLRDLPDLLCKKYFRKVRAQTGLRYEISDSIKRLVHFRRLNLSRFPYPMSGQIDIIFCRNAMIYFDVGLRSRIIEEFYRLLVPGGVFLVGHSENLLGTQHGYSTVQPSVYRKPAASGTGLHASS